MSDATAGTTAGKTGAAGHAVRVGAQRGLTEFMISLRNPEDQLFYAVSGGSILAFLILNRDNVIPRTDIGVPELVLPGALAAMLVFGGVLGPAFALALEREDGTLLRAKAAPNGLTGYVTGQIVQQTLALLPILVLLLVPSVLFLGIDITGGAGGVAVMAAALAAGLAVTLPLGMIIGAVARKPNHVGTWGMLPILAMGAVSGIFVPIIQLAAWLQVVAQVFPMYWLGHVLRWAMLPDEARVLEPGGEWRLAEALGILGLWAALGLFLAPKVLRRMSRRESGSAVEARRQERMQRLG